MVLIDAERGNLQAPPLSPFGAEFAFVSELTEGFWSAIDHYLYSSKYDAFFYGALPGHTAAP